MRIRINWFILLILLSALPALAEIPGGHSSAIDQYISERKKIQAQAAPVVDQLGASALAKLDAMETRLFPITVFIDRQNAEILAGEASLERAMKELKEQAKFNPYEDKEWLAKSHKDLQQLCCEIKANPLRQQQIINRVSQGLPALLPPGQRGPGPGVGPRGPGRPQGGGPGLGQRGGGGTGFGRGQGQQMQRGGRGGQRPGGAFGGGSRGGGGG